MHERAQTRAAVVAQLKAEVASVAQRVFKHRHDPLRTWVRPSSGIGLLIGFRLRSFGTDDRNTDEAGQRTEGDLRDQQRRE